MTIGLASVSSFLPPALRFMCRALGWLCILGWCLAALMIAAIIAMAVLGLSGLIRSDPVNGQVVWFVMFILPFAGLFVGMRNADRLFAALRRGDYFLRTTARSLRRFALGMVVYFLTPPLILLVLAAMGIGEVTFLPSLDSLSIKLPVPSDSMNSLILAVFLGAIILFASVWERAAALAEDARRLADENAQFV